MLTVSYSLPISTAVEIELMIRLGDDLDAWLLLNRVREEASWRRHWDLARRSGYCCEDRYEAVIRLRSTGSRKYQDGECCEKHAPEDWELDPAAVEGQGRLKERTRCCTLSMRQIRRHVG